MTFEEINLAPPLEMGKATYRQTKKGLEALQWAATQNSFKNSRQGGVKNNKLILWENNKVKKRPLNKTLKEDTKSHIDVP